MGDCCMKWQPIETPQEIRLYPHSKALRQREDGQWFVIDLPPLPEAEHDH